MQPTGVVAMRTLPSVGDYSGLHCSGNIAVVLSDTAKSITAQGDSALLPYLVANIEAGTLYIRFDNVVIKKGLKSLKPFALSYEVERIEPDGTRVNIGVKKYDLFAVVTVPQSAGLQSITTTNSSSVFATRMLEAEQCSLTAANSSEIDVMVAAGQLSVDASNSGAIDATVIADTITLSASNSSDVDLKLRAKNIEATLTNSSEVKMEGDAEVLRGELSNSSELEADELTTQQCELTMTNSSEAAVLCHRHLKADLSGSAGLIYDGSCTTDISTSGKSSAYSKKH